MRARRAKNARPPSPKPSHSAPTRVEGQAHSASRPTTPLNLLADPGGLTSAEAVPRRPVLHPSIQVLGKCGAPHPKLECGAWTVPRRCSKGDPKVLKWCSNGACTVA